MPPRNVPPMLPSPPMVVAMMMTLVLVIVVSAGLLALGPSLDTGEGGGSTQLAQPKCTPVSTVSVEALASIKFNSTTYTATGGCVQMDYSGAIGHTLQFRTLDYKGFPLGTDTGKPKTGKVDLKPGTYKIYCTIDSHAAQGMEATITVTAVNDLTVGKYDLVISVGPSYATRRLEAADSMLNFVNALPQAAAVGADLIAKNMDWPGADEWADRLRKTLPPGLEDQKDMTPQEQQQYLQQEEEARQKQADAEKIARETAIAEGVIKEETARKLRAEAEAQEIENKLVMSSDFYPTTVKPEGLDGQTQTDNAAA
jgi:plastocyanin